MILWTSRRQPLGSQLEHPLRPVPRTAILAPGFRRSRRIRTFPEGWTPQAERFRPSCIAGPLATLLPLADRGIELEHALVVFTSLDSRLPEPDRDLLWQAFGVPIFEQILAPDNSLIASECEAHDGLHFVKHTISQPGLDRSPCACGSMLPRLRPAPVLQMAAAV